MHRPHRVVFDLDVKDSKTEQVRTVRRTFWVSARNQDNAGRQVLKRFPYAELVEEAPNEELH